MQLTEGEAAILAQLMTKPDQAISYLELARTLNPSDMERWDAESLVRPIVFRLRKKIEAQPERPRRIRTVRGRGYMLVTEPST